MTLDEDGFLRRECPTCEQEFKWFHHVEDGGDAEVVSQYFCPLCGEPSGPDTWWTPAQLEYAQRSAGPELDRLVQDSMNDAFKRLKGSTYSPNRNFSLDTPTPEPVIEPNDMAIVEPPCHPNEPIKVPEPALDRVHCLICGEPFAV